LPATSHLGAVYADSPDDNPTIGFTERRNIHQLLGSYMLERKIEYFISSIETPSLKESLRKKIRVFGLEKRRIFSPHYTAVATAFFILFF
jgi:hypothetical protein